MQLFRLSRQVLALGLVALLLVVLAIILFVSQSAFSVWENLQQLPSWALAAYLGVVAAIVVLSGVLIWRLLLPVKKSRSNDTMAPPLTEENLAARLGAATGAGINTDAAAQELASWRQRRTVGKIVVAVFGEISSGKSSLIRALVPDAQPQIDVRGGTTRAIEHYVWHSAAGDELILADMPGTNEAGGGLNEVAREEALRAHIVVYVCEGDLSRSQNQDLQALLAFNKPSIVALNKTDRYTTDELDQIIDRLRERVRDRRRVAVVAIRAGGVQAVARIFADGRQEIAQRNVAPHVEPLREALQNYIDNDAQTLEQLRDAAVFVLVTRKLDQATAAHRQQRGAEIVREYTRKAIVGAVAAISPGTDLVIQGYLAGSLVKDLCSLYETPARQVDVDNLLQRLHAQTGKILPVTLAVAGNTLKAFPGLGTVLGGVTHAVAYGLMFDALGNAVLATLASRGELSTAPLATLFKEKLSGDLESGARRMVELALEARREAADKR